MKRTRGKHYGFFHTEEILPIDMMFAKKHMHLPDFNHYYSVVYSFYLPFKQV